MQNYLLSIFTSVGGIALVIVACQTIVFMEKANEERHYRETCAIHASDNEASAESTLKKFVREMASETATHRSNDLEMPGWKRSPNLRALRTPSRLGRLERYSLYKKKRVGALGPRKT